MRMAYEGELVTITRNAGPFIATIFTAVVLGVVDEAVSVAKEQVRSRAENLRPFEQVEWARAEQEHWVAMQAYEGALRAIESGDTDRAVHGSLRAKEAVAELAEQTLSRLVVCSVAERSPAARPSPTGTRTSEHWDSCVHHGGSPSTRCSQRR